MTTLLGLIFAAVAAATPTPQSSDPSSSWQKLHAQKLEFLSSITEANVVFIGDSLIKAFEESYGAKDVWDSNWAAAPYEAINLGFANDYTENVLWRITEGGELDGYTAKVIVLAVGHTNFKSRGDSVENATLGIRAILDAIKAKQPTAKIILSAVVPQYATRDTAYLNKVAAANIEFAKLADGNVVRWCGYDKAFNRLPPGYIRWTGALMPLVNAALRNDVPPSAGAAEVISYRPQMPAGAVNADIIIDAKSFVATNAGKRVVLRATGIDVVDLELAKYTDGRTAIWCGVDSDEAVANLLAEAAAADGLPVGPYYPEGEGEEIVYDRIAAVTPITRIRESSWRGADWWGDRLERNRNVIKASGGKIDFVFAGDSITHFWEDYGPQNYAALQSVYSILNCGYGGDQTQNVLWRFQNGELDGYEAKAVMLMIGTNNNGINGNNPTNTARGVEACVAEIKSRQPKAKIILMSYLPRAVGTSDGNPLADGGAHARNLATMEVLRESFAGDDAIKIVDIASEFLDGEGKIPKSLMSDYIHPTEAGYAIWSAAVVPIFAELTGVEPGHVNGDYSWVSVGGSYDGRFDDPAHWNLNGNHAVPNLDDRAFIGLNIYKNFAIEFPDKLYENYARFYLTVESGYSRTLDLSSCVLRHPQRTKGTYNSYGQFAFYYDDQARDILALNMANATPDGGIAPHLEVSNTVITASSSESKKMFLNFHGGGANFKSVQGHQWTEGNYPRLYLFSFNNNSGSSAEPIMDEAFITFSGGASLSAHNLCVQGNAETNVIVFSGGKHRALNVNVPARYDGQAYSEERTVTDFVIENGASFVVDDLINMMTHERATNRVARFIVKKGSFLGLERMIQYYGENALIADGGKIEFSNNQNLSGKKMKQVSLIARNGGEFAVNHTAPGGVGLYLGHDQEVGGTSGCANVNIEGASMRVYSPLGKIVLYRGEAKFGEGALLDNHSTFNLAGNPETVTTLSFNGATITNHSRFAIGNIGKVNVGITNTVFYCDSSLASGIETGEATVDISNITATFKSNAGWKLGYTGGTSSTLNFRSGFVEAIDGDSSVQFEVGCKGTARMNVHGGTLNLGRIRLGTDTDSNTDTSVENVLDIEGGVVNLKGALDGDGLCVNANQSRVSRVILNGGVLSCYRIFKSAGTAHLEADGGTVRFIANQPSAIEGMETVELGSRGLTIDNGGFTVGLNADFADKVGASSCLTLTGSGTTRLFGDLSNLSRVAVDGASVDFSAMTSTGIGALSLNNAPFIVLDPSKTIKLSGDLNFNVLKVKFTRELNVGDECELMSYSTVLTEEARAALAKARIIEGAAKGVVVELSQVEKGDGYVLKATARTQVNTVVNINNSSVLTSDISYNIGDTYTMNVGSDVSVELAGSVDGGEFIKSGEGTLALTCNDNSFAGGVKLVEGRLKVNNPASLGVGKDDNGKTQLKNGVIYFVGDECDYGDTFTFAQETTNDHVIVQADVNVTAGIPHSLNRTGGFTKRGPGRLTFEVSGTELSIGGHGTHNTSKGFWAERASLVYPQLFNALNGLMTNGTYGAFNVTEGELKFVGKGEGAKVVSEGTFSLSLPSAGGTAMPGLVLDNVRFDNGNKYMMFAACTKYSTPIVDDFAHEPYLVLTNGAVLAVGHLQVNRLNNNKIQNTKIDVVDSTMQVYYGVAANRAQAGEVRSTWNFRNSAFYLPGQNAAITLFRDFTMTFDNSVLARDASLLPTAISTEAAVKDISSGTCTMNFVNGSKFCCSKIVPPTADMSRYHPITLNFNGAEWIPTTTDDYTFEWAEPQKVAIVADGAGLKLPVPEGKTWVLGHPVGGSGDIVNAGKGTLQLTEGVLGVRRAVRCYEGCIDLNGLTISAITSGAGDIANGTITKSVIEMSIDDAYESDGVQTFKNVSVQGGLTVNLGRTTENPIARPFKSFVVCRYDGQKPNTANVRLKGTGVRCLGGRFEAKDGVVTCTPEYIGASIVVR